MSAHSNCLLNAAASAACALRPPASVASCLWRLEQSACNASNVGDSRHWATSASSCTFASASCSPKAATSADHAWHSPSTRTSFSCNPAQRACNTSSAAAGPRPLAAPPSRRAHCMTSSAVDSGAVRCSLRAATTYKSLCWRAATSVASAKRRSSPAESSRWCFARSSHEASMINASPRCAPSSVSSRTSRKAESSAAPSA
mmetsp:Transcript_18060/g.57322  ORF Transcript_18060/g.57322 Transcript_18060/m.57322 type:complete len:201 (-) Transcript_18060:312-914(-)